jgi:3-isopropylmalate/(R)-2-methylmalate dehydratase small subunit
MEPFVTHRGRVAVFDWSDVNTDLIIPARYLKRVERTGYGPLLFADKRYVPGGAPDPDRPDKHGADAPGFPLNSPEARRSTVLAVGRNFGCGSSREHAVWAVQQAGFRAVIAPGKGEGFADIFEGNAFNNGLLPIELDAADWSAIVDAARAPEGAEVTIDLRDLSVTLHPAVGREARFSFEIAGADQDRLLKGLDAIDETLVNNDAAIRAYEGNAPAWITPRPAGR